MKCLILSSGGLTCQAFHFIGLRFSKLQILTLGYSSRFRSELDPFDLIAEKCVNLQELNLSGHNITDKSIIKIAENCNFKLRKLCLDGCVELTNESIKAVAQYCRNLQHLSLSELSLDNLSILCIARFCLKLEYLNLACSWADHINNTANIRKITDPVVALLGKRCTSLRFLNVKYCDNLTQLMVHYLLRTRPKIEIHFKIVDCQDSPLSEEQITFAKDIDIMNDAHDSLSDYGFILGTSWMEDD